MLVVAKLKYVVDRGHGYEFRITIPVILRKFYDGKTAIWEPLRTQSALEAEKKALDLAEKHKADFKALKDNKGTTVTASPSKSTPKTENPIETHLKLIDRVLEMDTRLLKGYLNLCTQNYKSLKKLLLEDDGLSEDSLKSFKLDHLLIEGTNLFDLCEQVYAGKDLSKKRVRNATAREIISKLLDYIEYISDEMASALRIPNKVISSVQSPPASQQTVIPSSIQNGKTTPLISIVLEDCLSEKKRGIKTTNRLRTSTALLIEWYGDKPISFYTKERMKSFIDDCLLRTPPNRNKSKDWKDYSLKVMVKKTTPADVLQPDTMHNILSDLTTVFSHAVDEEIIFKHPTLKLSAKLPDRIDDVDRSYSKETLGRMMELLTYDAEEPSRYWTVVLGLYTGARLNEVCQLHLTDIKQINGIDCICINIEDSDETFKRVKNKPSRRTVPIHPTLKDAGFLKFVKQRKAESPQGSLLFKELTYRVESGYGRRISDWFAKFKKEFKPVNKYVRGFHSLRHTFINWAQDDSEMADRELLEMTGHETPTISKDHRRYSQALKPDRLNREMVKLNYGLAVPANPYMESDSKES